MAIIDDLKDVQEAVINELITENGITNTLADDQVTESKILNNAVTTNKIANGAVTAAKLGNDVSLTIADGDITTAKLDGGAVTTAKINTEAVTTAKIDDDAVTTAKIDDDAVTPAKLDRAYLESAGGNVSGSVGIGTNSPVDFGANFKLLNLNGVKGGSVSFTRGTNSATRQWDIYTNDSDALIFYRGGSSEAMRIQADGTLILSNVPTSAPSTSGAIWSDNGTLKIVT